MNQIFPDRFQISIINTDQLRNKQYNSTLTIGHFISARHTVRKFQTDQVLLTASFNRLAYFDVSSIDSISTSPKFVWLNNYKLLNISSPKFYHETKRIVFAFYDIENVRNLSSLVVSALITSFSEELIISFESTHGKSVFTSSSIFREILKRG